VTLNYKNEGNIHKTSLGGIVSLFIYGVMLLIVLRKIDVLINNEEDTITSNHY
jgi:hypothetical protein